MKKKLKTEEDLKIEIIYKPKKDNNNKVKIFGETFVENNINICKIIYNKEYYELKQYLEDINTKYDINNLIIIKLKGINNIINASEMFCECISLISLPNFSELNISKVIDINNIFFECESLVTLPDISKWDTSNITDMSGLFAKRISLISLPDISNWNTEKVKIFVLCFMNVNY